MNDLSNIAIHPAVHAVAVHAESLAEARRVLLGTGVEVITYTAVDAFLALDPAELRGVVVADARQMGLIARLAPDPCHLPLLVLVPRGDVNGTVAAMRHGAFDAVEFPFDDQRFPGKIADAMAHDERHVHVRLDRIATRQRIAALSRREKEILGLLLDGLLNKQIAAALGVRENTVEVHRSNLMRKLHARTPVDLARMVISAGARPARRPRMAAV